MRLSNLQKTLFVAVCAFIAMAIVGLDTILTVSYLNWDMDSLIQPAKRGEVLAAVTPELPREYMDTTMPQSSYTCTVTLTQGQNLQTAINNASLGDTICLTAGVTFTGNFQLPKKTVGSGWVTIRTTRMNELPEGVRVKPGDSAKLAKIVTPKAFRAFETLAGASHYRLIGLEVTSDATITYMNDLIRIGNVTEQVSHIVLDRMYIHGHPDKELVRCVFLNGYRLAVINSYLSDAHVAGQDTQAIAVFYGDGVLKIANNYLEAAAENFMVGGAVSPIEGNVPSDIEFRGNYLYKPLTWRKDDPSYAGKAWTVKNLFELKLGRRVLVEGNIMENSWPHGQTGMAFNIKAQTSDSGSWAITEDVTIRNNIIRNASWAVRSGGDDYNDPTLGSLGPIKRHLYENNLFENIGVFSPTTSAYSLLIGQVTKDIAFVNNTIINSNNALALGGSDDDAPSVNFVFKNNILGHGLYGVKGGGRSTGNGTILNYGSPVEFANNVLVGNVSASTQANYPTSNFFPSTWSEVGFVDYNGGNYVLSGLSQFANTGVGADMSKIAAATAGVKEGTWSETGSGSAPPPSNPVIQRKLVITLDGIASKAVTGTLAFVSGSTRAVVASVPFTTNAAGEYTFAVPAQLPVSVMIRVSVPGYLPKVISNTDLTTASLLTIAFPQLLAGDFNSDGIINSLDYSSLNRKWNQTQSIDTLDINRDGIINSLDYAILSKNWGKAGE